jgi:capsular polysaccharide transport system permease protein
MSMDATQPLSDLPPRRAAGPRFQHLRVVFALVVREMAGTYGRSAGGYFWAIAQPLGGILLLSIAFSLALRSPPLGSSFLLFYGTGIVPFTIYNVMSNNAAGVIRANKGLLTYPVVTVIDALIATFLFTMLTQCMIAILLFTLIIEWLDVSLILDPVALLEAVFLAGCFGMGVGSINAVLFGFFPTWKNIWGVLTRPLFITSSVIFLFERASPKFQAILAWNPIVHVIGRMRHGIFNEYNPAFVSLPYVAGASLATFLIGAYLLRRHASFLLEQ